ncbi:MAG: DNA gyrase subunit A [Eubacteriales bacterium]|nr:DNA gyrase subunit A [Eubacteriales bacterium]
MTKIAPIQREPITDTLEKNYMPYAMSVIVSRAIPEIDGFKPSHRKLLYTMYKMGLLSSSRTKSANVVGQTMKLNPHGDQAIYETLVRLTRGNDSLIQPYIDSKGNFGKVYSRDMHYAAARYTEVRLDSICQEIFSGLDKNSVDMIDNYDGTMKEPMLLPATFPSVLVNSNQGIAVGMASNICSFNLAEVCAATVAYILDPACDVQQYMPAPDFSTGAELILHPQEINQIYQTGRGSFRLRAIYQVDKKNGYIEILQIPYTTSVEAIIDDISNLVKTGKIKEINDVRDETDIDGLKLTIDYKRAADPDALMQKLFRFTTLENSFPCNFNILINGTPRVLGVKSILGEWHAWRRACLRRELAFDLGRKQDRLHLLKGLEKILLDIDQAIKIIRETELESEVINNLMQGFAIDSIQAEYVAEIRLRQLNRQYLLQRIADIKNLKKEIADLQAMLGDQEKVDQKIIEQLQAVSKKYGRERRTRLIHTDSVERLSDHELIEDYRLRMFLTSHGYVKKIPLTSLRSAGDLKTKDDDQIIQDLEGKNKMDILFFTTQGNVYKLKVFEIKDHKPSDFGEFAPNLLSLDEGEKVIFMHLTDDYSGQFFMTFANGKAVRLECNVYETKTNRRKLVNAFSTHSPIVGIFHMTSPEEFVLFSSIKKVLIVKSEQIPLKATRSTQGIAVLLSKKGSTLVNVKRLSESGINEPQYYRTKVLPAIGSYLKESTLVNRQVGLDGLS